VKINDTVLASDKVVWLDTSQIFINGTAGIGKNVSLCVTVGDQSSEESCFQFNYYAPTISHISPVNGTTAGNTSVTVYGSNFVPQGVDTAGTNSSIFIGGKPCVEVTWVSATEAVCLTPPGMGINKTVEVVVANQSAIGHLFSYFFITIHDVQPRTCPTLGNCNVTLSGENFGTGQPAPEVYFENKLVQSAYISHTQMNFTIPPGTGTKKVINMTLDGKFSNDINLFSYEAPVINSVTPNNASSAGGVEIVLEGKNYGPGTPAPVVTFDGNNQTTTYYSDSKVSFIVPSGTGINKTITVTVDGQTSNVTRFSYIGPRIDDVRNNTGPTSGESTIHLIGKNFGTTGSPSPIVKFNGSEVSASWVSDNQVDFILPVGTGANKSITIEVANQTSPTNFIFSYEKPIVHEIQPRSANTTGGIEIIVLGNNYGPGTPTPKIQFEHNDVTPTYHSHTKLSFVVPAGEGKNKSIIVTVDGQTSNENKEFNYNAPIIDSVEPNPSGTKGGVTITLQGANYGTGDIKPTVTFNGEQIQDSKVQYSSHNKLTFELPPGIGTKIPISVSLGDENSQDYKEFSYSAPTVDRVDFSEANTDGSLVTITGSNFVPSGVSPTANDCKTNVTINGKDCTSLNWQSDTKVVCTAPAGTGKDKPVIVTVCGQSSESKNIYNYDGTSQIFKIKILIFFALSIFFSQPQQSLP
jgi:hypothetical protein